MDMPISTIVKTAALLATLVALLVPATASAITGGSPDGSAHPYVGMAGNGVNVCSGSLVSPTVYVTAGHCFATTTSRLGTTPDGHPIVKVSFDPRGATVPSNQRVNFYGVEYAHPQFCEGCGTGPSSLDHDVAVVKFATPIPTSIVPRYAQLPRLGLDDTLGGATADIVGYGIQVLANGGGQDPEILLLGSRYAAQTTLLPGDGVLAPRFVKLGSSQAADNGGVCRGDSGGPNLVAGTDTIAAITSFGMNDRCKGVAYSYRLDTPDARDFLSQFVAVP